MSPRLRDPYKGETVTYQEKFQYGAYYHLYYRGNNKEALFKEDANYFHFLDLYKKYLNAIAALYAYCLLPTHFHLLVRVKEYDQIGHIYSEEGMLSRQFRTFLGTYAKEINNTYQRSGILFADQSSRKLLERDNYFFQLIVYIHQNPQIHGIASDFKYWPFSSYNAYSRRDRRSLLAREIFSNDDLYNRVMETQENLSMRIY